MFCSRCGKEVNDEAVVCVHCGCAIKNARNLNDAPSTGFAVLGFIFPWVGLILYLVNKDTAPLKARSAGKGALIGFCIEVAFYIFFGALISRLISAAMLY